MPSESIAQRLTAVQAECPVILQGVDEANGSAPDVRYVAEALRRLAMLSAPPLVIGRIEVPHIRQQDVTGIGRVVGIRDEPDAINDAFAHVAPDRLCWTQEFDDVQERFADVERSA